MFKLGTTELCGVVEAKQRRDYVVEQSGRARRKGERRTAVGEWRQGGKDGA